MDSPRKLSCECSDAPPFPSDRQNEKFTFQAVPNRLQERILLNIDTSTSDVTSTSDDTSTSDVTTTSDVTPASDVTPTSDVISNDVITVNCSTKSDADQLFDQKVFKERNAYIKRKANSLAKWHYLEGFALEKDLLRGNFKTLRQGFKLNINKTLFSELTLLSID